MLLLTNFLANYLITVSAVKLSSAAEAGEEQHAASLAQANQSVLQHRQRVDQLSQLLADERAQKAKLVGRFNHSPSGVVF